MISEITAVILATALNSGGYKVFNDQEVNTLFSNQASSQKVGTNTKWVDVTKQVGRVHSLWLEKTKENHWELRGSM